MTSEKDLIRWGLIKRVRRELYIDRAIQSIDDPNSEIKKNLAKNFYKQNNIDSQDKLNQWFKKNEMSKEDWENFLIRPWKWGEFCKQEYVNDLNSHYLKRKSKLDTVTYSLLRTKSKDLADELFIRIKENESTFSDVASQFSEGPEKKTQGIVGPLPIGSAHPALGKLLLSSYSNQLWAPRKLEDWWIIVRLEKLECKKLDDDLKRILACELGEIEIENSVDKL